MSTCSSTLERLPDSAGHSFNNKYAFYYNNTTKKIQTVCLESKKFNNVDISLQDKSKDDICNLDCSITCVLDDILLLAPSNTESTELYFAKITDEFDGKFTKLDQKIKIPPDMTRKPVLVSDPNNSSIVFLYFPFKDRNIYYFSLEYKETDIPLTPVITNLDKNYIYVHLKQIVSSFKISKKFFIIQSNTGNETSTSSSIFIRTDYISRPWCIFQEEGNIECIPLSDNSRMYCHIDHDKSQIRNKAYKGSSTYKPEQYDKIYFDNDLNPIRIHSKYLYYKNGKPLDLPENKSFVYAIGPVRPSENIPPRIIFFYENDPPDYVELSVILQPPSEGQGKKEEKSGKEINILPMPDISKWKDTRSTNDRANSYLQKLEEHSNYSEILNVVASINNTSFLNQAYGNYIKWDKQEFKNLSNSPDILKIMRKMSRNLPDTAKQVKELMQLYDPSHTKTPIAAKIAASDVLVSSIGRIREELSPSNNLKLIAHYSSAYLSMI